jgi:hypothetical protein
LGPHLIISGFAYTESIECNEILAIKQEEFRSVIEECYSNDKSKLTKLPRYILQLESIGVLIPSKRRDKSWEPNPELFERLRGEEDIIVPIQNLILR